MEYACMKTQSPSFSWRFSLGFQMIFLLLIYIAAFFYPESPRHLAKTGRAAEARDILRRCRRRPSPESVEKELNEIKEAINLEATSSLSHGFISMIWKRDHLHTRRRVGLAMGVQLMQKLVGPDVVSTYGPYTFALSGCKFPRPTIPKRARSLNFSCLVNQ